MQLRQPVRVTHTYTQTIDGPPRDVMPLLCPVFEREWVRGWEPSMVVSASGVAERDCVFITPDAAGGEGADAIWTILEHDAERGLVEMLKVTPEFLVVRLRIALRALGERRCLAEITYTYTALSERGEAYVRERTPDAYVAFMQEWESSMNAYLHGTVDQSTDGIVRERRDAQRVGDRARD